MLEIGNSIYSEYIVDWLVLEFPEIMERGGLQKRNSIYSRYNVEWLVLENLEIMKEGGLEIGNSKYSGYIFDRLVLEIPEIMERGGLEIGNSIYSRCIVGRLVLEIPLFRFVSCTPLNWSLVAWIMAKSFLWFNVGLPFVVRNSRRVIGNRKFQRFQVCCWLTGNRSSRQRKQRLSPHLRSLCIILIANQILASFQTTCIMIVSNRASDIVMKVSI